MGRFFRRASGSLVLVSLALWASLWFFLAVAARAAPPDRAADAPPRQAAPPPRILGGEEVRMLRDPGGQLGIDDLLTPEVASRFEPIGRSLGVSYTNDAVWLRLTLRRAPAEPADWRLELTSTYLNDVRFFEPQPGGGFREFQAGDQHPFAERVVPFRRPVFDIHLPDDAPRVFHLRLRSDSTFMLRIALWERRAFDAAMQRDMLWIGGLGGIVLISMLFFVQAWLINRDRLLLGAAVVTLSFAWAASINLGLLGQYLLPGRAGWADLLHPLALAVFFPLLMGLFGRALDIRALHPGFHRLQWLPVALCVGAMGLRWIGQYGALGGRLMMLGMLLGLVWISAGAWLAWRARRRNLHAAVALTLLTAMFAFAPLMALDIVPPARDFELFWVVSCIGFILMAQITALNEVKRARAQRRQAEQEALAARRQAEQELSWRRQQTQYFVGVAHDLRTPLTAMRIGLANLQRLVTPASAAVSDKLGRLDASCRRLAEMIDRHLQLQRLEQPDLQIERGTVLVADCLAQIQTTVVDLWPQLTLRVQVLPDAPPHVEVDRELVMRALSNLVTNAAKAAPPGTAVEIEASGDGAGGIRFRVRDRGPGLGDVPLEKLVHMHWAQRAAGRGADDVRSGSFGIGLPVVHRVAVLHGGSLSYARELHGVTAFILWLPAPGGPGRNP